MQEMHLKQPGFTYSACGPFTRNKERAEKFMQTWNAESIFKNELDKACFQHDMANAKSKDLIKRTQSGKVLRDKAFKVASGPKFDGYQRRLTCMVYKLFNKKYSANEIHKQIIKKFKRRKVYLSFRNNIWGVDLTDIQSLSKHYKEIKYLLCKINFVSKYGWVPPLNYKRLISIFKHFSKNNLRRKKTK